MTAPLLFAMPGNEAMTRALAQALDGDVGAMELRAFPDGETYLRLVSEVAGRRVVIVCTLDRPNTKILPLIFAAATARDLGAVEVGLVVPYLAYMRQDQRFRAGEAVTSRQIGAVLSDTFDWLVTVDPHLHRYPALDAVYRIPTRAAHSAPLVAAWIRQAIAHPIIIGPDSESVQWAAAVAADIGAPYSVLQKIRRGDREVEVSVADRTHLAGGTPVLVDDIISSGRTMIAAVSAIAALGGKQPLCIAVHGVFADDADALIERAGARVVTTSTIPHRTNAIDVTQVLVAAIIDLGRR